MPPPRADLAIVTVVFGAEVALLDLQARSLARHLDPAGIAEIVVLDNGWRPLPRRVRLRLLSAYGPLADRVEFVRVADLVPELPATIGWRSQQIAKLLVASRISASRYLVLDAKNHLVRRSSIADVLGADGRAHGASHPYGAHPLRPQLERTMRYLGADDTAVAAAVADFPPTATPFVIDTLVARDLVADVEARAGRPFALEFERAGLLEFFLYSAWLELRGGGVERVYDGIAIPSPTVWPRLRTADGVAATIAEARAVDSAFFAVHRTALARGTRDAAEAVAAFWVERGLFRDRRAALGAIRAFRSAYVPEMALKRVRERIARLRAPSADDQRSSTGSR